jgi:uncharacterized protein (TIGR00251 family)
MQITLHVKPNSKIDRIYYENGQLKVKIKAQPIDGKANVYLVRYLSSIFKIPASQIVLLKGSNSKCKKVQMPGNQEDLIKILEKLSF